MLDLQTFGRSGHEDRIGVVDVRVYFSTRRGMTQEIKAAVADRQMIHLARAASGRPNIAQFVVAPECAVEQDDVRIVNRIAQFGGDFTDRWRDEGGSSRDFITQLKRDALAQFNRAISDAVA